MQILAKTFDSIISDRNKAVILYEVSVNMPMILHVTHAKTVAHSASVRIVMIIVRLEIVMKLVILCTTKLLKCQ